MSKCLRCGAESEWIQGKVAKSDNGDLLEIERLDAKVSRYRAALEYYSKEENWAPDFDDEKYILKRPGGMRQVGIMLVSAFLKPWIMAREALRDE